MYDMVVLVNEKNDVIGYMKKLEAHRLGLLHRAFSIFVFDHKNRLLMQQRAKSKYHSGGLWTNTCCSHPRSDEETMVAVHRRLLEEMGFDCDVHKVYDFIYKTELDAGLTEYEFDEVMVGRYDGDVEINPHEVEDYKWMTFEEINEDLAKSPENYTEWFKLIMARMNEMGIDAFIKKA